MTGPAPNLGDVELETLDARDMLVVVLALLSADQAPLPGPMRDAVATVADDERRIARALEIWNEGRDAELGALVELLRREVGAGSSENTSSSCGIARAEEPAR